MAATSTALWRAPKLVRGQVHAAVVVLRRGSRRCRRRAESKPLIPTTGANSLAHDALTEEATFFDSRVSGAMTAGSVQSVSHIWFGLSGSGQCSSGDGTSHLLVFQQLDVQFSWSTTPCRRAWLGSRPGRRCDLPCRRAPRRSSPTAASGRLGGGGGGRHVAAAGDRRSPAPRRTCRWRGHSRRPCRRRLPLAPRPLASASQPDSERPQQIGHLARFWS
jgi:hypothetical protein